MEDYDFTKMNDWLTFYSKGVDKGTIEFSTYSYQIASNGLSSLDEDETYKLYLIMKEYYEKDGR